MKLIPKTLCLLLICSTAYSQANPNDVKIQKKENMEMLAKLGLPTPGGGIKILPLNQINPDKKFIAKNMTMFNEQSKNGFVENYSNRAQELLNFHKIAPKQYRKYIGNNDPNSTHLRKSVSELRLAFDFREAPRESVRTITGFAPIGGYHENGWSGAVEFFETALGSCAYSEISLEVSQGSVWIAKEAASDEINGKTTLVLVEGNDKSGYTYDIQWYDNTHSKQLECANHHYDRSITNSIINLARKTDTP